MVRLSSPVVSVLCPSSPIAPLRFPLTTGPPSHLQSLQSRALCRPGWDTLSGPPTPSASLKSQGHVPCLLPLSGGAHSHDFKCCDDSPYSPVLTHQTSDPRLYVPSCPLSRPTTFVLCASDFMFQAERLPWASPSQNLGAVVDSFPALYSANPALLCAHTPCLKHPVRHVHLHPWHPIPAHHRLSP